MPARRSAGAAAITASISAPATASAASSIIEATVSASPGMTSSDVLSVSAADVASPSHSFGNLELGRQSR
jgi:hypothetical protein